MILHEYSYFYEGKVKDKFKECVKNESPEKTEIAYDGPTIEPWKALEVTISEPTPANQIDFDKLRNELKVNKLNVDEYEDLYWNWSECRSLSGNLVIEINRATGEIIGWYCDTINWGQ